MKKKLTNQLLHYLSYVSLNLLTVKHQIKNYRSRDVLFLVGDVQLLLLRAIIIIRELDLNINTDSVYRHIEKIM